MSLVPGLAQLIELSTEGVSQFLGDGAQLSRELLRCVQQAVADLRFGEHVPQALSRALKAIGENPFYLPGGVKLLPFLLEEAIGIGYI